MTYSVFKKIKAYIILGLLIFLIFGNLAVLRIYYPLKIDILLNKCEESYKKSNYDKAETYSLKLIATCSMYERINFWPWNHWNYGNAVHIANTILGLIEIKRDDIGAAKKYLIASGETPGSPQLDTFGPNMVLAKELLTKGEKETVLNYFQLCSNFWNDDGRLAFWSEIAKKDMMPAFDNRLLKF